MTLNKDKSKGIQDLQVKEGEATGLAVINKQQLVRELDKVIELIKRFNSKK